jgi:hypothetical protein
MSDREERLEAALLRIRQWAEVHSTKTFRPLTDEQVRHVGIVLEEKGYDIGALRAQWARHILFGVSDIAKGALRDA